MSEIIEKGSALISLSIPPRPVTSGCTISPLRGEEILAVLKEVGFKFNDPYSKASAD